MSTSSQKVPFQNIEGHERSCSKNLESYRRGVKTGNIIGVDGAKMCLRLIECVSRYFHNTNSRFITYTLQTHIHQEKMAK